MASPLLQLDTACSLNRLCYTVSACNSWNHHHNTLWVPHTFHNKHRGDHNNRKNLEATVVRYWILQPKSVTSLVREMWCYNTILKHSTPHAPLHITPPYITSHYSTMTRRRWVYIPSSPPTWMKSGFEQPFDVTGAPGLCAKDYTQTHKHKHTRRKSKRVSWICDVMRGVSAWMYNNASQQWHDST